jgi:hypothetical protein
LSSPRLFSEEALIRSVSKTEKMRFSHLLDGYPVRVISIRPSTGKDADAVFSKPVILTLNEVKGKDLLLSMHRHETKQECTHSTPPHITKI